MRAVLDFLYRASGWAAAIFIVAICALVIVQVACNIIDRVASLATGEAIGLAVPSYSDFTGFFLAASSFLALAHTFRSGSHIRVNLLLQHMPENAKHAAEIACILFATAVTLYFTWYTKNLVVESFTYNDLSAGMVAVPIWIPQMPMLAGLIILSIALLDELQSLLRGRPASYAGQGDDLFAASDVEDQQTR